MGGKNNIVLHNSCKDSLLPAPIILDLVLHCSWLGSELGISSKPKARYTSGECIGQTEDHAGKTFCWPV
ncbi:hypothetical protein PVAP13_9KG254200 [Panicum virgatum]|uniref:Uncharacterized protein n=1 Tax=Panicum virgatum TaxID=38727 RepID=A0A8T0NJF6_PANVG|nr:hypothetical protein PVAP13_9KG254200 [Panicum virgatum]